MKRRFLYGILPLFFLVGCFDDGYTRYHNGDLDGRPIACRIAIDNGVQEISCTEGTLP